MGFCEAGSLLDHPNPLCVPTFDFSWRPSGLRRPEPEGREGWGPSVRVGEVEGLEVQGAEGWLLLLWGGCCREKAAPTPRAG